MAGVRLDWEGKQAHVERLALPLQVVETVNAPRADRGTIFEGGASGGDGWRNRLIWGDNAHVLASLADELAGQVDLVYIDPPFDSRQDYKVRIGIGDAEASENLSKLQSVVEEKAYRDTWGAGVDSYLQMLYTRLVLLRELLSDRGSIFLHLAPNVSHYGRLLLEEVFGVDNFRAEIVWKRTTAHADTKDFATIHDAILCFSKTDAHHWNPQFRAYDSAYLESKYRYRDPDGRLHRRSDLMAAGTRRGSSGQPWRDHDPAAKGMHWKFGIKRLDQLDAEGRIYWPKGGTGVPQYKRYLDEMQGQAVGDWWDDLSPVNAQARERLGFDTQKPEALLERIIRSSSDEGSIVLDCFAGSGTTPAVAERLGRRWVACDIGRFAIHTTRKRLLDVPGCKPFVVANLGRYERQVWQRATTGEEVRAYLDFVSSSTAPRPWRASRTCTARSPPGPSTSAPSTLPSRKTRSCARSTSAPGRVTRARTCSAGSGRWACTSWSRTRPATAASTCACGASRARSWTRASSPLARWSSTSWPTCGSTPRPPAGPSR